MITVSLLFAETISSFQFEGNRRTKEQTLITISTLALGDTISDSLLDFAEQKLLRTELFALASITADSSVVTIRVAEKWSIIPFVSFQGNGSSLSLINTGLYDANFLGRAATIGADYTYLIGTHGGQLFAMKDNIGEKNLKLTGRLRTQRVISSWYSKTGQSEAGFITHRKSVFLSAERPMGKKVTATFATTVQRDELSDTIGGASFDSLNSANGFQFEGSNLAVVPTASIRFSNFRYKTFSYSGWGVKGGYGHAFESDFGGYNSFSLGAQWYKELPLRSNLAINGDLYGADGHGVTNLFYLGGMNGVRGFPDNFFRGRAIGKMNLEFRIPSLNTQWIVLQHAFFSDFAVVADRLTSLESAQQIGSSGVGIRILSPKIYSFMIRLDYGWGYGAFTSRGLSFGTTHYFRPF